MYKALYRIYRPNIFNDIKGQEHIKTTLMNILRSNKIGHAYLFSGPRGTGKTSVAKIFAKSINCPAKTNGVNSCENCSSCISANKNRSLDIIEMDAASNNGIVEIREIKDRIKFAPTNAEYKIYIIDEIHMLSKGAFNALLKTLEEPPKHAIFILATTEPEKIPITILSRVQRFNFGQINKKIIESYLKEILEKEKINCEDDALKIIASLANGSLRDAISIIDQSSSYTNGKITTQDLYNIFGIVSLDQKIDLLNWLAASNLQEALKKTTFFVENGINIKSLVESLIDIVKDYIIYEETKQHELLTEISLSQISEIKMTIKQSYFFMNILVKLLNSLLKSEVPVQNLTLAILKMTNFSNTDNNLQNIKTNNNVKNNTQEFTTSELSSLAKEEQTHSFNNLESDNDVSSINPTNNYVQNNEDNHDNEEEKINEILSKFDLTEGDKEIGRNLNDTNLNIKPNIKTQELKKEEVELPKHTTQEIINLLMLYDKNEKENIKECLQSLPNNLIDLEISEYVELFIYSQIKLLSAGKNFILFTSNDKNAIDKINKLKDESKFINFVKKIFEKDYYIYIISNEQWIQTKTEYLELKSKNNLPKPKQLENNKIIKKTDKEEYATKLFGDLFKSNQ